MLGQSAVTASLFWSEWAYPKGADRVSVPHR